MPEFSCGHKPWMNVHCVECRPDLYGTSGYRGCAECKEKDSELAAKDLEIARLKEDISDMITMVPHYGCHDKKNPCAKCMLIDELNRRRAVDGKC